MNPSDETENGTEGRSSQVDDQDFEASRDFARAMDGDRTSSLEMWRSVAQGKLYREHVAWIRHVAMEILKADQEDAKDRPSALMKAVGLAGKDDGWRRLREVATVMRDFGCTREVITQALLSQGLINDSPQIGYPRLQWSYCCGHCLPQAGVGREMTRLARVVTARGIWRRVDSITGVGNVKRLSASVTRLDNCFR